MKPMSTRKFARTQRQNMNHAEARLWSCLKGDKLCGLRFRRQYPVGPYFADFACPRLRLIIEVDGATHWTDEAQARDARRHEQLQREGWHEIRVSNEEVYRNLDRVLEYIAAVALKRTPL